MISTRYDAFNKRFLKKELNHIEKFYIINTFKFLKNDDMVKLLKNYATVFSSSISFKNNNIKGIFITEENLRIINRDLINFDSENLYEDIETLWHKEDIFNYKTNSKIRIDYLVYKYKNYFIITNSVSHNANLKNKSCSKIYNFENDLLKFDNKWETIENNFPLFNYSVISTANLLQNIFTIIDNYSLRDINVVKFILDIVNKNKCCLFLYIIDNKNNMSITFKTIKNKSSIIQSVVTTNFNLKEKQYVANNFNSFFVSLVYGYAFRYFNNFNEEKYDNDEISYCTLKSKMELKSIDYANLIDNFSRFFMSEKMLDDSLNEIDFVEIKIFPHKFKFDFFNLSKEEYTPFRINFYYHKYTDKIALNCIVFNDFNKKNPYIASNNKGPSYVKFHDGISNKYSVCYSITHINKKNKITKKYFNSYENLPLIRKNKKEYIKMLLKYDDSSVKSFNETYL